MFTVKRASVPTLTFRVRGNPAARSFREEKGLVWLSGDFCVGLQCHMTTLHNGERICLKDSQTDLEQNSRLIKNPSMPSQM